MSILSRIVFFIFLLFAFSEVNAQQQTTGSDNVYGSDPLLYNGKFYTYYPPLGTEGNQYFTDRIFETGSAIIRGVTYNDLLLNYDIFNQQLVLKYKQNTGANSLIIISDAWLTAFNIGGLDFEIITAPDTVKQIFQVIGKGPARILYYWEKELELNNMIGAQNYVFSSPRKEMNLFNGSRILLYRNNKSFYSLFDTGNSNAIKEYLRVNRIKVKRSSDSAISELINYCNTLLVN